MPLVIFGTCVIIIVSTIVSIHTLSPDSTNPWPALAFTVVIDWGITTTTVCLVNRAPLGWSNIPKRISFAMFDCVTWIICEHTLVFAMCAAYLAGKALSGPTAQASDGGGVGGEWEATRLKAGRVLVFGLGMPLFRILFLRAVEVTPARISETTQSVVDRERSAKLYLDPAATDCECGNVANTVSVDKDEIIADPGLVRMLLGFESAFSMVDTVIILLTPDNTAFALAILSSHFVHLVQCFFRARRWRNVLAESKLKTGGIAAGLNTWVTITTTNGVAAYITTVAAMVMVLWFDARGVFNVVHPHATREQVAARTAATVVVQLVVNIHLTAFESRNMGVAFKWKRVRLPLFAKFEAAAMVMLAVGAFLVVERGVFGVF
ncbi:hypothetical protein HK104_003304 [Borealophlyctis nickersoniae]|nr:hypothetical protein HK104_003304 [Borealophlyctis nickersoniae]